MKTLLYSLSLFFFASAIVHADVWVKPPYKPDENHPPISDEITYPKEAQEEAPVESDTKKHQEVMKPNIENGLDKIDDQLNEGEESTQ